MADPRLSVDFFRHGIAAELRPEQEDGERALTTQGVERTHQVAQRLKQLGWHWDWLLVSPLVRAQQTADVLIEVGLARMSETLPALAPGGHFQALEQWYLSHAPLQSLAVIGHQPDLGQWIAMALWGPCLEPDPNPTQFEVIQLKKAGVARVDFPDGSLTAGRGILSLLLRPKVLLNL